MNETCTITTHIHSTAGYEGANLLSTACPLSGKNNLPGVHTGAHVYVYLKSLCHAFQLAYTITNVIIGLKQTSIIFFKNLLVKF